MVKGMAGIGHIPFQYVHDFSAETDAMILELPTDYLRNWIVGDCHNMVLTMRKDDLAAARWDALIYQVSN
jgi:soluble P-type ATPase